MVLAANKVIVLEEEVKNRPKRNDYYLSMVSEGEALISSLENTEVIGSKSKELHFVTLLGLASKPSVRREGDKNVPCPTTIGVTLISDKAIKVPVIDVRKNKDTGIKVEDISFRRVVKGKPFHLNMYELMFLVVRKEYAGFMEYNGDPQGVYFSPKLSNYSKGTAKLPTPALAFKHGFGSIKANMVVIDEKVENGWVIKPEYTKEFGALIEPKDTNTEKAKKKSFPAPTIISVALGKLLEEKYEI